jgi:hypothetical protein
MEYPVRMDERWRRLATYVEARRQAMGAPPRSSIINANTYRRLMRGRRLEDRSLRKIEAGLGWTVGSADRVLAGGEPALGEPAGGGARARHLDDRPDDVVAAVYVRADGQVLTALAGASEDDRREILRILARARAGGNPPCPGEGG